LVPHVVDAVAAQVLVGSAPPATTLAHVPLAPPVCAPRHDWHLAVHGVLQQTWLPAGPTHVRPAWHWLLAVQSVPWVSRATHWCDALQ
jgi:hypothetical protein